MAKAVIQLIKGRSLSARGRTLLKGFPQTITDLSDIRYYESVNSVKVTRLEDEPEKVVQKEEPKKEVLETETLEKNEEEKEELERPKKTKKVVEYSEDELNTKKKRILIDIAASLGVYVDSSDKKKDMIAAIINAQKSED